MRAILSAIECFFEGHRWEVIDADGFKTYLQCDRCGKDSSAYTHSNYEVLMKKKS